MKTFVCKLLLFLTAVLVHYNALADHSYFNSRIQLEPNSVFSDEGLYYHIVSKADRTAEVIMPCDLSSYTADGWYDCHNYDHTDQSLTIPSRCIGDGITYKVVGIGRGAFMVEQAKEITLPPTISYISDFAFAGIRCETINIPAACSYINESAFRNPTNFPGLDSLKGYLSMTYINKICIDNQRYSFIDGCLYCADKFNDKTHYVGDGKPKSLMNFISKHTNGTNIEDIKTVNLPYGIEHIFESAFEYRNRLQKIIIPNSVDTIGPNAFYYCTSIEEMTLPIGLKHISKSLFTFSENLKKTDIPNGVKSIGAHAFSYCIALQKVTLPDGMISIGDHAFASCTALQKVAIPDGMISIGEFAFSNCTDLTDIILPASITSIGAYAFNSSSITRLELPDGIETLEEVFASCHELETIKLPKCLKSLDNSHIEECLKLRKLFCPLETPIPFGQTFANDVLKNATLYVPIGSKGAYEKVDPWRNFWNIEEYDPSASLGLAESESRKSIIGIYDLNGRAVAEDAPGIKIVRYSDGSVSKSVN